MKKIGLMCGMENSFPPAVIEYINNSHAKDITAETLKIGAMRLDALIGYDVILDRISYEVPYYRSVLLSAVDKGIKVINNPKTTNVVDNFLATSIAANTGVKIPRTVVLPSKERPLGTNPETFRNMVYPLNWDEIFNYIGFPAYIKPNVETPTQTSYKIYNITEFFAAYDLTNDQVMLLQEAIDYEEYFRCYVIGRKHVRIMNYDPYQPLHLRFNSKELSISPAMHETLENHSLKIANALGFDFCAIEYAFSGGELIATELFNISPTVDQAIFRQEDFDWLVAMTSEFLIGLAKTKKTGSKELILNDKIEPVKKANKIKVEKVIIDKKAKKVIKSQESKTI